MIFLEFLAVLTCVMFTGAAVYINFVEHPARLACGTELAAKVFGPSYDRASRMQASLAIVSAVSALGAYLSGGTALWLVGAACIFFVIPFTFAAIMATNKKLKSADLDPAAASTRRLLLSWGRLHAVRSAASLAASCIFLYIVTAR